MNSERNLLKRINVFVLDKHLTISDVAYFFEMETEINKTFLEVRELLAHPEHTEQEDIRDVWQDGYEAGLRLAKREPLNKEQYMKFFTDTYDSVNPITDFVKAIEKAHGIGGGE